jgi:hypothetical protein
MECISTENPDKRGKSAITARRNFRLIKQLEGAQA